MSLGGKVSIRGRTIARRLVVSEKYDKSALYKFFELGAAVYVGCFVKHINNVLNV